MFYIRVDANKEIATGHVMRCLSVAEEIRKRGEDSIFITADNFSKELITSRGFKVLCLHSKWNDLESEADKLCNIIKNKDIDKLLVDSYYVTDKYLEELSRHTKVIYIDDLGEINYPVNTVINYNNYADKFNYKERFKGHNVNLILGSHFVPLREEFQNVSPVFREVVKRVLISTGGGDIRNAAGNLLKIIACDNSFRDIEFMVIAGKFNSNLKELLSLSEAASNIKIYQNIKKISELMLEADIAVTAGGSTMYELCACGVPMITYTFADNQLDGAKGFADKNAAIYAGDIRNDDNKVFENIIKNVRHLKSDMIKRKALLRNTGTIVNKQGVKALVDILQKTKI